MICTASIIIPLEVNHCLQKRAGCVIQPNFPVALGDLAGVKLHMKSSAVLRQSICAENLSGGRGGLCCWSQDTRIPPSVDPSVPLKQHFHLSGVSGE